MSLVTALERIEKAQGFYVKQNWNAMETVLPVYQQENTFEVYNIPEAEYRKISIEGDVKIFHARETTHCCERFCCGKNRSFSFKFQSPQSQETLVSMSRSYRCCGWAVIPCCAHKVSVHSAIHENAETHQVDKIADKGKLSMAAQVGVPKFHGGCISPTLYLYDENNHQVGNIWGSSIWFLPCIVCDFCGAKFWIYKDLQPIGEIKKLGVSSCRDCLYELHTDADKYVVEFDEDALPEIDANFKLAVLASVLQLDFTFFESKRGCYDCHCCDIYCCGWAIPCCPVWCMMLGSCMCCLCRDSKKKGKKSSQHLV